MLINKLLVLKHKKYSTFIMCTTYGKRTHDYPSLKSLYSDFKKNSLDFRASFPVPLENILESPQCYEVIRSIELFSFEDVHNSMIEDLL